MNVQRNPDVGTRLLALRQRRGLSLRALAELSSLSANTISLIERGITSPSVSTLHSLSRALGVPITAFFVEPDVKVEVLLTRAEERTRSATNCVLMESLGSGVDDQAYEPFLVTLDAGASSGPRRMVHAGQELVYCMEGNLEYEINGVPYKLEQDDSLHFHATLPHRWRNLNRHKVRFLLIMQTTDDFQESVSQHLHRCT